MVKARLGQCRRKQVRPLEAPEYFARGPGNDACNEQRRGSTMDGIRTAAGYLMQSPKSQAAAGQTFVDLSDAESQHLCLARPAAFEALNAVSQF